MKYDKNKLREYNREWRRGYFYVAQEKKELSEAVTFKPTRQWQERPCKDLGRIGHVVKRTEHGVASSEDGKHQADVICSGTDG